MIISVGSLVTEELNKIRMSDISLSMIFHFKLLNDGKVQVFSESLPS